MTAQAADPVWGYPDLRSEASGHCLARALGQDCGDKRLWAGSARGLQSKVGDTDTARLLASCTSKQRATTSATLSPSPRPAPLGGDGRAWLAFCAPGTNHHTRPKPQQRFQSDTWAPLPFLHPPLHHARSNLLRDDPLSLIKDTCIEHQGSMFAGHAVQSSHAALGSPGPGIWPLGKCFCSTCNFTHHCIGLVILLLEPCFAIGGTLVPRQKNSTGFSPWITDSEFQATYSKN